MSRGPSRRSRRIHRDSVRADVNRELEAHISFRAAELEREGWAPAEARAEAERRFGDRAQVAEAARAEAAVTRKRKDRASMLEAVWRDIRIGARSLARTPGFVAVAVLTLALGIGANTAVFTVVSGVLLKQPPYPEPDELVLLWEQGESGHEMAVARPNYEDWRRTATSFEAMAEMPGGSSETTVLGGVEPVRAQIDAVGGDFFSLLGVPPERGRVFGPEESSPGQPPVVVVSHGFWRDALGAPADLSTQAIRAYGLSAQVVGVMPPGFDYPYGADVWFPAGIIPDASTRTAHNYRIIGRLADGVSLDAARAEMTAIATRLRAEYGPEENNAVDVVVRPLREERAGDTGSTLALLLGAAGFVLLIASANIASALLARGTARVRETAVRSALGAGGGRIVRQLVTENLLLAGAGGLAGLAVGWLLLRGILTLNPDALPAGTEIALDPLVLGFALAVTAVTALLFGLGPSVRLARTPPATLLRSGGRGAGRPGRGGTWSALVAAEVALALILLVGSGLLVRSFQKVLRVDPGYDVDDVLTATLSLPSAVYPEEVDISRTLAGIQDAVRAVPGAGTVGGALLIPLATRGMNGAMQVEGVHSGDFGPGASFDYSYYQVVLPGYFESMDIPIVQGRAFTPDDDFAAPRVAVVNRALAEEYWPAESPIGHRVRGTTNDRYQDWITVVGVVENVHHASVTAPVQPELYVSALQRPNRASYMTLTIETDGDPAALAGPVRRAVRDVAPQVPARLETFRHIAARDLAGRRFALVLLAGFALIALLLAALGIYGVVAYTVGRRTREIGIRIALGAEPRRVMRAVQKEMLVPVGGGAVVGVAGALLLSRVMGSMLFNVEPIDPATFAAVTLLLVGTAAFATWVPARRSTRVDPVEALAEE